MLHCMRGVSVVSLILGSVCLAGLAGCGSGGPDAASGGTSEAVQASAERPFQIVMADARELEKQRDQLDQTVWKTEVLAQRYEQWFTNLWDTLLVADDTWAVLQGAKYNTLSIPPFAEPIIHQWNITEQLATTGGEPLTNAQAVAAMKALQEQGYVVVETEWHHAEFNINDAGDAHSVVTFLLHVVNDETAERIAIKGKVEVDWLKPESDIAVPQPGAIRARDMRMLARTGEPVFREIATVRNSETTSTRAEIGPILAHDMNHDGSTDLVLVGANEIMWNDGNGNFRVEQLSDWIPPDAGAAVLADFTGNGEVDMLIGARRNGFFMFPATGPGTFDTSVPSYMTIPLDHPFVLTAGDVDGDGDMDAWLGQYRMPYSGGEMPTPYYDANDGYPAYLLINDGTGKFTDGTEQAGLVSKRFRRTYSGSLVDVDGDVDLDLVVMSDFAGIDIYHNDGSGNFTDMTSGVLPGTSNNFGMGHAFADFNRDGVLDFFTAGMSSTTARRLDKMEAGRFDHTDIQAMRAVMGYGNRMYLGDGEGSYTLPDFNDTVARTGWSWGTSAADFDNDGHDDIYIANGHASGESTKDYCTTFWRHDIYECDDDTSAEARDVIFQSTRTPISQGLESWNGYEHNNLLLNFGDERGFMNVAFLFGAAFEYDSRQVIASDLNNDGRADLVVMEMTVKPHTRTLHIYQNALPTPHDWIGVRLARVPDRPEPIGSTIRLTLTDGTVITRAFVSGDSNLCQHPLVHTFGLGDNGAVERVEITWPDGSTTAIDEPESNRYHTITPGG